MRSLIPALVALFVVAPGVALAQTVPPPPNNNNANTPGIPVCYTSPDVTNCPSLGSVIGKPGIGSYYVPLSALAYSSTTDALANAQNQLAASQRELAAVQTKGEKVLSGGIAMSSAIDMISPADGRRNRIGGGISAFNDQAGAALVYIRQNGAWDAGIGLATSRYQNMAKATISFSW